ncbi:MAG: hypothetical protein PHN44_00230 [Candidatus Marinimicrobia bacterium]|nr:hypothetical protein [Candidatus Neomarinimicrobiota bacterium]
MSEKSLIPVETKEKIEKALEFFYTLKEVKFSNDQEYENGVELCRAIKQHIKVIDDDRKIIVKPLNDQVGEINGECNGVINKLKNAESVIKRGMGEYFAAKERRRIEDQRRLEAEAEERRRQEEEKARKEKQKAEAYRDQGRDEMADKAEARAETAASIASTVTAPIVENTAKVSGTTFKKVFKISVVDKKPAVESMLMNDILLQYISIDEKGLTRLVNAQKGNIEIPGIRITEDVQVGMRL